MPRSAGMKALALQFPSIVRTNDYWAENHPELVHAERDRTLANLFNRTDREPPKDAFDIAMEPYLADPFRGSVERRILGPHESALSLELAASRQVLKAAQLAPEDVDLVIASSLRSDFIGVGDATHLAQQLGTKGAAFNMESMCSGALVMFQTASALVQTGQYRNVLVAVSCTYSRDAKKDDTLSFFLADGGAAFLVGQVPEGQGFLGGKTIHTGETIHTFYYEMELDSETGEPRMVMLARPGSGKVLRETSGPYLRTCCRGAAQAAGVRLDEIDFFIFNTPTAWFADFAVRALGIDPERTVNTNPWYANVGSVLMPANLHFAARTGRIRPGNLLMLYSVGSVSSASAAVMQWGQVELGDDPPGVPFDS